MSIRINGKIIAGTNNTSSSSQGSGFNLFDTKVADHVLEGDEALGWALQGTYVYKEAIAGSRFGYPDFYSKCLEEKEQGTSTEITLGSSTITMYLNGNGHQFYDIANKDVVDAWFNTYGIADFYGVDAENECIFLPRNDKFIQLTNDTSKVNDYIEAGLPNITGGVASEGVSNAVGAFYTSTSSNGANGSTGGLQDVLWFDASRVNPIYGKSDIVQPPSSLKLLYYCVGNTVADTSWVDVVTQVEGGVKDLEDKTLEGIERLKASSNALTTTQITNCITEIPQDIKLEMVNGVPTLRAGSKCYIPNGFEEDGVTPRFDEHITQIDLSFTGTFGASNKNPHALVVWDDDRASNPEMGTQCSSGPTAPTTYQYNLWYDTTNNIMKWTTDYGATWTRWNCSLPVGLAHYVGTGYDGGWEAIDQVFNGIGYFGSTVFVTKGVKGLIPNGRNEDGTLNNIEYTTEDLWTFTSANSLPSGRLCVGLDVDAYSPYHEQYQQPNTGGLWLDTLNNYMKRSTDNGVTWEIRRNFVVASYVNTNGVISNFKPKQPFRAVDYSDKSEIAKWGFPDWSKKTDQAVNTTHTAKSQGWIIARGITSNNEIGLKINDTYVAYAEAKGSGDTSGFACLVPINKGQTYISTGNVLAFMPCQG